ncbi:hypothetical protein KM043_002933 [Ampulex compressa]|nr:hypothetical protein KM043_002933 [Ampulex compressa]
MSENQQSQDCANNMTIEETNDNAEAIAIPVTDAPHSNLENDLLSHIAKSKAVFKSQQKDEPDLTYDEKLTIAQNLFVKNHCLFLSKFGPYLKPEHLQYFEKLKGENYEITHHIERLRRYFDKTARHIDVRNRRYQALKVLIEEGEYFSEREMMKRNPLLYKHLIGQYMTEEQERARDGIDANTSTFLSLLMEKIERDNLKKFQEHQEEEERNVLEENDSDDDSQDDHTSTHISTDKDILWGETSKLESTKAHDNEDHENTIPCSISNQERQILMQEFVTLMYQNFLDGKDLDFDYSKVDENEAYDNVDLRAQDEEEKYFDSESPETLAPQEKSKESESEDELDVYMRSLKEQIATNPLSMDNDT